MGKKPSYWDIKYKDLDFEERTRQVERDTLLWEQQQELKRSNMLKEEERHQNRINQFFQAQEKRMDNLKEILGELGQLGIDIEYAEKVLSFFNFGFEKYYKQILDIKNEYKNKKVVSSSSEFPVLYLILTLIIGAILIFGEDWNELKFPGILIVLSGILTVVVSKIKEYKSISKNKILDIEANQQINSINEQNNVIMRKIAKKYNSKRKKIYNNELEKALEKFSNCLWDNNLDNYEGYCNFESDCIEEMILDNDLGNVDDYNKLLKEIAQDISKEEKKLI